ncbi:MAG: hypothetical protein HC892_02600 [Saprospiraceae bacterium]|nr:hypothetical protein [Saprospiraceae bacterium]
MNHADKIIIISSPEHVAQEQAIVIQLFEAGLQRFHLRKPNYSDLEYAKWLSVIPKAFWNRIVLHHHHSLAEQLGLAGVHLTTRHLKELSPDQLIQKIEDFKAEGLIVSAAIHDLATEAWLGNWCDYVLISPVFDSISKSHHQANPNLEVLTWRNKIKAKMFGLSGINPDNIPLLLEKGYFGAAVLGYIWSKPNEALQRLLALDDSFEQKTIQSPQRPFVLTIAGHDPSGGAGLTADIKTFEQAKTYGLSVCTAITIQNDTVFERVYWMDETQVVEQILILTKKITLSAVKIGLIPNWWMLQKILEVLDGVPIILDPIMRASAGFKFHDNFKDYELLKKITLLTPNRLEIIQLIPDQTPEDAAKLLSQYCAVLLKGGHDEKHVGQDQLWQNSQLIATFHAHQVTQYSKHGSGCVLSAAISAQLAKNQPLVEACRIGKQYTETFLNSTETLLGFHHS